MQATLKLACQACSLIRSGASLSTFVEVVEELLEPDVAVLQGRRLDPLEDRAVNSLGVVVRLQQERRDSAEHDRLLHALGAVAAEVASHLAGSHREAAEDDLAEIELLEELLQVRGVGVVVVTGDGLA
jgi:hypothetical protein